MFQRRHGEASDESEPYVELGPLAGGSPPNLVVGALGFDAHSAFDAEAGSVKTATPGRDSWAPTSQRRSLSGGYAAPDVPFGRNRDDAARPHGRFREQFRAFRSMAMPYFRESCAGRRLFVVMVILTLLNSAVRVVFSYLIRDFWSALSEKDEKVFYEVMVKFILALVALAPINVLYRYQRQRLAIKWREWMTDRTLQLYSSNRVYYSLERGREIDNPDQRIAEDVKSFTNYSLSLFLNIVTSSIDLASFSVILYSIMPDLFIAIAIFASTGTVATIFIGKKLIRLNFEKLWKEANFRYSLVRMRENAESIAFYAGEDVEGIEVNRRFSDVIGNMKEVNVAQRNLDFFTTLYNYLTWILPVVVVAPEYFAGNVEMGVVQQSASAFGHVLDDLSLIVNSFQDLSEFSAGIDRLFQFMNSIREHDPNRYGPTSALMSLPSRREPWSDGEPENGHYRKAQVIDLKQFSLTSVTTPDLVGKIPALTMNNVSVFTPDRKRVLVSALDLSLKWGDNLLIAGSSGAGKSSLLRAIAGLWTAGSGTIDRPADGDVYFLPQRPYCALGSLRDQLLYPSLERKAFDATEFPEGHRINCAHLIRKELSDQDLLDILDAVDLSDLACNAGDGDPVCGLDTVLDWSNILSLGEQQRLAFGRILVNRPRLIIMDESTSALDVLSENRMYSLLKNMKGDNFGSAPAAITYISVGHRPTLLAHHNTRLVLRGGNQHSFEEINKNEKGILDANILS